MFFLNEDLEIKIKKIIKKKVKTNTYILSML